MQGVVTPCETSEHSVSVLDSEAELPFHHLIVLDAVKRHFGFCDICCVRLADQRDLIAVAKTDETTLDIFIPCNAPAAPSSISWTTEHLVERLLPPPSSHRPLTAAISRHLRRQIDEGSIRSWGLRGGGAGRYRSVACRFGGRVVVIRCRAASATLVAFAYPLFGATPSFISHLQIGDVSANLFWHEIVRLVLQRNSRLSFLSFRTKNTVLCEIELLIHQFHLSRVWQGYDCHPLDVFLRDISDLNDPLVVGILRTCLLPYIHGDADIIKLLPVYRLIDIMLSTSVCGAFADYHPRVVVAMLEDCNLVENALRFCGHLHTLLGESQLEGWVSRVFPLYQHCSEQLGIFGTSLRTKWRFDWRDVSYLLERLERQSLDIGDSGGAGSSRVPRLTQVACRVFRYTMRQYLDGLPPPRPSFTAQIESLKGIPPAVKRIILFKAEDS
ncbi:hypothetical protein EGR_08765 [Echinococcus granulosus]|uniref:Uncharacterized protein n=1 Tax=Echinococcus granulosus TaxID=6210 RepID=W6U5I9_ECHGR|nr:hypothetical protein EGR_08765 [Echinococcus granulosus]EUB56395.1 hypothetical protein EGR_08765 [Echinococcus granulosus]